MKFKPGDKITLISPNSSRRIFTIHSIAPFYIPPRPAYKCYPQPDYIHDDWVYYGVEETDKIMKDALGREYTWKLVEDPQDIMKQIL